MSGFSLEFYQPLKKELTQEEQNQLLDKLRQIYESDPHDYQDLQDFELCKAQLLKLLAYIEGLDSDKLKLFSRYKENVQKLSRKSSEEDINVTLKSAKKSLEASLLAIDANFLKVNGAILDCYLVTFCYPGAYLNLELALGHFQVSEFSFYVEQAKRTLLLQLISGFLNQKLIKCELVLEIEEGIVFFNYLAPTYGLSPLLDPIDIWIFKTDFEKISLYIKEHFTVAAFIHTLKAILPAIPQNVISTAEENQMLHDFFQALGEVNPLKHRYLQLFEERDTDDFAVVPRASFNCYYSSLLALALEQAGYLEGVCFTVGNKTFLDNGTKVVDFSTGRFQKLTKKMSLSLFQDSSLAEEHRLHLSQQLREEYLFSVYQASRDQDKSYYFSLLLKRKLSLPMVESLFEESLQFPRQQSLLANYVFQEGYILSEDKLEILAQHLTLEQEYIYLRHSIQEGQSCLAQFILRKNRFSSDFDLNDIDYEGQSALMYAAAKGDIEVLLQLLALGADINQTDFINNTAAAFAVKTGQLESLNKLCESGADLTICDSTGCSLTWHAAEKGYVNILIKLHQFGANLNQANHSGDTPAIMAGMLNHPKFLVKLHELGADLNHSNDQGPSASVMAAHEGHVEALDALYKLGIDLSYENEGGVSPALIAVQMGQVKILEKLREYGVDLTKPLKDGSTLVMHAEQTEQTEILIKLQEWGIIPLDKTNSKPKEEKSYPALVMNSIFVAPSTLPPVEMPPTTPKVF